MLCFAYLYLFKDLRGITRYTIDVCNALALKGKYVAVICPFRRRHLAERFLNQDVKVFYIPHFKYKRLTTIPGFLWCFLNHNFDAVNISLGFGEAYAAVMAKRLKKDFKYNVLLHMAYEKDYPLFSKLYNRGMGIGLFDQAEKIITVSHYVKETIQDIVNPEKVYVTYNGVNLENFYFNNELREKMRKELGVEEDELLLLTTSAISVQKNIPGIFPAMRELIHSGCKIRYMIAGYGSKIDLEYLNGEIRRYGLEENVIYLGEYQDTMPLYNAADIFVLLSQYEAFGISVIEAAACGLPCMTSNESAFPEIVNHEMGFRVNKNDPSEMIKVINLLKEKKRREIYRRSARSRVETCFDVKKNIDIFLDN